MPTELITKEHYASLAARTAGKINKLDTIPATVDGGLWYELSGDLPELKFFRDNKEYSFGSASFSAVVIPVIPTPPPLPPVEIVNGIVPVDDVYFKLTGFASGLIVNFSMNTYKGYEIKKSGNVVGYLNVDDSATFKYTFNITNTAALDTSSGTFSVEQVDATGASLKLDLTSIISDLEVASGGYWKNEEDGDYSYRPAESKTVTLNDDTSYTYETATSTGMEYWIFGLSDSTLNPEEKPEDAALLNSYVQFQETRDETTGEITAVTYIFTKAAFDATTSNDKRLFPTTLTTGENDNVSAWKGDDYVTTYVKLADDAKLNTDPVFTAATGATNTHEFKIPAIEAGFRENANSTSITYSDATEEKTLFTITNLADDLALYNDGGVYKLYKPAQLNMDGDTVLSPKANTTPLVTINGANVTINDIAALKGSDNLATATENFAITLKDYLGRENYKLDSTVIGKLSENQPATIPANFSETADGTYTYSPDIIGWHFEAGTTIDLTSEIKFIATGFDPNATIKHFVITGLPTGLSLTFDSYDNIKAAGTTIGSYDDGDIKLSKTYLKTTFGSHTSPNVSLISSANYRLLADDGNSITSEKDTLRRESTAGTYTYRAKGTTAGYYTETVDGAQVLKYRERVDCQEFTISGLYVPSGFAIILLTDNTEGDNNGKGTKLVRGITKAAYQALTDADKENKYTQVGDNYYETATSVDVATIAQSIEGGILHFTLDIAADALFETYNTTATITATILDSTTTNVTLNLATDNDTAAISRTFDDETFAAEATAGTYIYTATGSTVGYQVSDADRLAISYVSTELSGKTFTLNGLRTDLGTIALDAQGYINATNGSTIGHLSGSNIKLYKEAVHKLFAPTLSGTNAADFNLVLPT